MKSKNEQRIIRHKRIRAKVKGNKDRLRLSVFKSNRSIYAQLIDDENGKTIVSARVEGEDGKGITEKARAVGVLLAKRAKEHSIKRAVFDRSGYRYAGAIKALATGAREGGLEF